LNDLINHANIKVSHPYIDWGRSEQLSSWVELVDNDKLFVLAGFPPSQPVNPGNLGRMFLHPSAAIRGFAVENAIDQITFRHPGAVKVLLSLKGNPNLLSAEQTFKLAVFLENPANATEDKIRPWLETKPDPKLLETLLLSSANESGVDTGLLDFEIASYLQRNKWRFDIPKLQVLALHNDAFTRSYAYFETAKLRDTKMALQILETALAQETDPNFRVQLQSNIETLKAAGTSLGN
jgi:hypothetical protein